MSGSNNMPFSPVVPDRPPSGPPKHRFRRGPLCPLLWAAAVIVVGWGISEFLDRRGIGGLNYRTQHIVHFAIGAMCAALATLMVAWTILRSSPGFGSPWLVDSGQSYGLQASGQKRYDLYARWFMGMRWLAVLLAGVLVFFSVQIMGWLPTEVWWPLAALVVALAMVNVLHLYLLRIGCGASIVLLLQGYIDLIILTGLLHFSGGIENPCSFLMIFHVIIGGILLERRQAYCLALSASLLFAVLAFAEWSDIVEHYTLQLFPHMVQGNGEVFHLAHHSLYVVSRVLLQAVVMFLTAYFVTTLAERLRANERQLEAMADQAKAGQQLLEQALDTTGAALRVMDRNFKTYWANARWEQWFSEEEKPGGEAQTGTQAAAETLNDGKVRIVEVVRSSSIRSAEAASLAQVFQLTAAPLWDAGGKVQRVVELAQDVTVQKQDQARLIRAGRLAAVGELAGRVAHESNHPIAIISAKARILLADHRAEMSLKLAQELGKIVDYSDRVARIAQGLLSYCRLSSTARVPLDIRQPIRRSLAMIEQHARASGIVISDELSDVLPLVRANGSEMEQVFLNLFLNALDAMPHGGQLSVRSSSGPVQLANGRPAVAIAVEDSGTGIAPAIRERVFEPFFTTKEEGKGTGLGLSICLGLVQSHGGEIEVTSQNGARFIIRLPVDSSDSKIDTL